MRNANLWVGNEEVGNIFQLLGYKEDSISLAVAWSLTSSPRFCKGFLERIVGNRRTQSTVNIRIHRYEADGGITDIEIYEPNNFHIVIEAKRGWILPDLSQLKKYAKRHSFSQHKTKVKRLVTLSECSEDYAKAHLPATAIDSVPVVHFSWKDLVSCARVAKRGATYSEKRLLNELIDYFGIVMTSQRKDSNLVYVVSLGGGAPEGWKTSWVDIVRKYSHYFHPIGPNWPKEPPAYIGFRYSGKLQSIHYIKNYDVIDNLRSACSGIPDTPVEPHFLYTLGKAIIPDHDVKNGNVYPSGRVWCALDTLLTSKTVSEARDITQKRMKEV